jgi:hypothetical protein
MRPLQVGILSVITPPPPHPLRDRCRVGLTFTREEPHVTPRDLEVELPGQESFVRMARLVVAGFASTSTDLDEARIGGLRMAVAEACRSAIEARALADSDVPLRLRARLEGERLHVWVEDPAGGMGGERLVVAELLVTELGVEPVAGGGNAAHLVLDEAHPRRAGDEPVT